MAVFVLNIMLRNFWPGTCAPASDSPTVIEVKFDGQDE